MGAPPPMLIPIMLFLPFTNVTFLDMAELPLHTEHCVNTSANQMYSHVYQVNVYRDHNTCVIKGYTQIQILTLQVELSVFSEEFDRDK